MSAYDFETLKEHVGHDIVCVTYAEGTDMENVAVECETCHEVLLDYDKYPEEEEAEE